MNRKSVCSFLYAMMLAILLISCNDDDDHDALAPSELNGTYSNKLSAPANGDSLILSYNGNTCIGKDVEFKTDDGKTADIILKYVLPHDKETAITAIPLTAGTGSYSFSGNATASTGTVFRYQGSIQAGRLVLELSDITIPENRLATNRTWFVAHGNASYYDVDNGSMQTIIGMLYNLVGGKLVSNLISSVLDDLSFQADGNIIARYAPLPDSVRIGNLIGSYVKHSANDWIASPPNLAAYYVEDNTSLYVIPQIDMIIRQVMINKQTKAGSGDSSMEDALLAAYRKINTWSTTGIKMTIRESEEPAKGDLILILDKSEIQELFALLDIVKVFIPEETLNTPVMDLLGDLIPPQFAGIAGILLKGKTLGAILDQLSQELNTIPIEIGIYLYKDKPVN
ncbi:DUF4925 domain-containing protein [uncultured Parabacteroides sp.]|jgi:hypothetical protein|uniref:DUF4925 domain-containing protein n=1 Tax=uncultured Parabacteroides sp. TaxID=512312 RepID=UPI0025D7489F|nr:DUF4925 domain-containing protein [uncultured Parabacteroides sp.]